MDHSSHGNMDHGSHGHEHMDHGSHGHEHMDHSSHQMMDHHMNHSMEQMVPTQVNMVDHDSMDHSMHDGSMDHSMHEGHSMGHEGHSMGHMMMMYFHGGYNEVILFDFWRISTIGGLIGSMVGCFLLGVLYEGLKFYREYIFRRSFSPVQYESVSPNDVTSASTNGTAANGDINEKGVKVDKNEPAIKTVETSMWSKAHILLTFMHMVQMTLAYFLMLIFMTYNSWLCLATVLGATFGYFLFGWRKTVVLDVSDHCH